MKSKVLGKVQIVPVGDAEGVTGFVGLLAGLRLEKASEGRWLLSHALRDGHSFFK